MKKRRIEKLMAVVMLVVMLASLTACGNGKNGIREVFMKSNVIPKW